MAKNNKERRSEARTVVSYNAAIIVDDRLVSCGVVNISGHGAYVKVEKTQYSAEFNVGESVLLSLFPDTEKQNDVRGTIVRKNDAHGDEYVAVYFPKQVIYN